MENALSPSVFHAVDATCSCEVKLTQDPGQSTTARQPIDWGWTATAALVAVCVGAGGVLMVLISFIVLPDYSTFWTAARLSLTEQAATILYDAEKITELQSWLVRNEDFRPWIYPPSTLFVLLPFAPLPFWISLGAFSIVTLALYFAAARFFSRSTAVAALASASFSTVFVALHGHFTNLIAAIVLTGLVLLSTNPLLAGALFGIAATIKPQLLIFAPLALLAGRHYSALISSIATGVLIGIASVMVFGIDLWLAWARSLPMFLDIVRHNGISDFGVTPVSMASQLGLEGTAAIILRAVLGVTGIGLCWRVFRVTDSLPHRLTAMIGGGFLVLPYAMNYELAILAPAAAMHVLGPKRGPVDWALAVISTLVLVAWWSASIWAATAFTLAVCATALMAERRAAHFLRDEENIRA
jgi:hypothetical protein